jgi:hypothetical protein
MSKKSMILAGVAALAIVAVAAALFVTSRKPSSPTGPTTGAPSTTTSSTAGATTSGTVEGQSTSATSTDSGGASSQGTKGGTTTDPNAGPLKPFPHLPDPGIAAESRTAPAAPGETLPPLTEAPSKTVYALALGKVFSRGQYTIVMRPYGLGPDSMWGSGLVIRVDSAKPVGKAPANIGIANSDLLVIPNTTDGGTVTKGGTYKATLTFRSDGTKLLPILSKASLVK